MTEMVLPQFGMGMADGTIIAWHKAEGDRIEAGEPLCDVEAAKTTVEVPAPFSGILQRIIVPAGANVPVNTVIALIGDAALTNEPAVVAVPQAGPASVAEPAPMAPAAKAVVLPVPEMAARPAARAGMIRVAMATQIEPRARRAARLHSVDLSVVNGTGPNGRIIESDILNAAAAAVAVPAADIPTAAAVFPAAATAPAPAPPPTGMRQLRMQCDARPLIDLLAQLAAHHGAAVPVEVALLRATALAAALGPVARGQMTQGSLALGDIGLRCDAGGVRMVANLAGLSLSAIARHLDAADSHSGASPALVIEWHDDMWLDEVINLDPSGPACLSFGLAGFADEAGGEQWTIVLTLREAGSAAGNAIGPSFVEARQLLQSLREVLTCPLAILA